MKLRDNKRKSAWRRLAEEVEEEEAGERRKQKILQRRLARQRRSRMLKMGQVFFLFALAASS